MTRPARSLTDRLELDADGPRRWRSRPDPTERHLFGGLLVGQALHAAAATVDPRRPAQSVHGTFLRAGDGRLPVWYEVEVTRTGTSFSTRRVVASQERGPVFVATAGFHAVEAGPEYEPAPAVDVPGPEGLPSGRYDSPWFESRDVPVTAGDQARRAWFRARLALPDDLGCHAAVLAYLSDHGPTRAVRQPHASHPGVARRLSVSLDHAVWLHRPARADGWLLSELVAVSTGGGRGLAIGTIRSADGRVLATVAQEALLRLPEG